MTQKKSHKAPEKKTNKKVGTSADSIKEIEELTSQLEEANQTAKDNWESFFVLKLRWRILNTEMPKILKMLTNMP